MKKFFKATWEILQISYSIIFYRLAWEHNPHGRSGYVLQKRIWMWVLFSPVILTVRLVPLIFEMLWIFIKSLFTYEMHYISPKDGTKKISFKQWAYYRLALVK